jgi:peptidoglycan/xylan/chitin deacetylase (PgdA/CDA1 family)
MYHRIAEKRVDPWSLCVTPQHFAEHLEVLQNETHPISLRELVQSHNEGNIPDRAVVVTFDDGYADNLYNAKPLLEKYNIPATVFVPSGHIGSEREFWWDELERILLQPGRLPEVLTLNANGKTFKWELGEAANYREDECHRNCGWIINYKEYPSQRHSIYLSLLQLLQPLLEEKQYKVIDDLLTWAGTKPVRRQTHRTLSLEELLTFKQGELIEVGAHAVTHPFLSSLPESLQQDEILRSKTILEESIGQQVRSFAYPYGNYTTETVAIVRETGFDCACSIIDDSFWRGSDLFQLPRVTVVDWDGEKFAKRLSQM